MTSHRPDSGGRAVDRVCTGGWAESFASCFGPIPDPGSQRPDSRLHWGPKTHVDETSGSSTDVFHELFPGSNEELLCLFQFTAEVNNLRAKRIEILQMMQGRNENTNVQKSK